MTATRPTPLSTGCNDWKFLRLTTRDGPDGEAELSRLIASENGRSNNRAIYESYGSDGRSIPVCQTLHLAKQLSPR